MLYFFRLLFTVVISLGLFSKTYAQNGGDEKIWEATRSHIPLTPPVPKDALAGPISSDGKTVMYMVNRDGKVLEVINGQESAPYDRIELPFVSPNGKMAGFLGFRASRTFVIVNLKESEGFSQVNQPQMSSDGEKIAFWGRQGEMWSLYLLSAKGEVLHKGVAVKDVGWFAFSSDGAHLTYESVRSNPAKPDESQTWVCFDRKEYGPYDQLARSGFDWSAAPLVWVAHDKDLYFIGMRDKKYYLVKNGEEKAEFNYVFPTVYVSGDGRNIALLTTNKDGRKQWIMNGIEGPLFDAGVWSIVGWSQDQKSFTYFEFNGSALDRVELMVGEKKP